MKLRKTFPNFTDLLIVLMVFFVGIAFVFEANQYQFILYKLNNGETLEYQGAYNILKKEYLRNTNYIIELDNGDSFEVPCEHINENQLFETFDNASFRYSRFKGLFKKGQHVCVSIDSIDKTIVFMQEKTAKTEMVYGIITGYIIGIPCIIISFFPLLSKIGVDILLKRQRTASVKTGRCKS